MATGGILLVATDFSAASDVALDRAVDLARGLGAEIEVLHVHKVTTTSVPPTLDMVPIPPSSKEVAAGEEALADRVARVRAAGLTCEGESRFGKPEDEIVRRAVERSVRLIVLGSHGASTLRHVLLGSVTESVLADSPCPLVVVPRPRG
jgi:nucleotide-binding universal stress UspA family protein